MQRKRNLTVLALTVILVAGGATIGSPSQAAVRTKATIKVSTTRPIANESLTVSGQVSTHFKRRVVVRVAKGHRWKVVGRVRTKASGAYRLRGVTTTRARRYDVLVPAARHSGKVYKKVVTRARLVRPVAQSGVVDVLPQVAGRGTSPAASGSAKSSVVASFSPARPGRRVTFSRQQPNGSWVRSPATRQGPDGTAYYVGASRSGSWAYPFRATTSAARGAPSLRSGTDTDRWTPTFADEFSGTALDESKWSYRLGSAPTRTRSTNVARMVKITGGTMRLSVALDPAYPNASAATSHYLNAQVASEGKYQFTYGVASARIRFSRELGQHGSFWLQSPTYASFPGDPARSGAEVDAVEYFGQGYRKGGLANFLYYRDRSRTDVKIGGLQPRAASLLPSRDTFANSYHVYTVRWTPRGYTFYIDGRVLSTSTRAVSRTGEYLILSLLTSDWELPHLDRGSLPTTMSVDWAKVWQDG